jgi:DNA-binding SARP family transcriptional activator
LDILHSFLKFAPPPPALHLHEAMGTAMPPLTLRCLGPPAVQVDGRDPPPDVVWRKHLALLAYLALSPDHTRTRAHLMGLLWGERLDEKARRSLNEAVRLLRATLGDDRLITDGDALRLNPRQLDVDVLEFERLGGEGQLRALDLVRGEFLEGFHVEDAPAFEDWIGTERARIRDLATQLLVARAAEQLAVNRHVEARALARRALTLNPYSEPALSLAMRSAALESDAAGALATYHEFTARLERELGERPSRALDALADRIRTGKWQRPRGRHAGPPPEPPLVGRRESHAQLFDRLEHLSGAGPCCLVITGEPGSGRTRLLDACAERLALAGATVATARILESDHDAPWSTLRALMRGGLLEAAGLTATDHVGMRVLAGLVPELAGRVDPLETRDLAQVADALASLFRAVTEQQPVVFLIDDAQWADGATLVALRAVWSREREAPLALVLTLEMGADLAPELRALVGSVAREIPGAEIRLDPLTGDEVVALSEAMAPWCTGKEDRERLARRVAQESGGNPFLAVTLLRDLGEAAPARNDPLQWPRPGATYDSTLPIEISAAMRSGITTRVARLDEDSQAVLRAAGVAGAALDQPLLTEVLGMPDDRVDAALDRLERERFVVFDGARYAFNGRLLPSVIERECVQPGGRRRLRERYIAALKPRDDIDSQLLRAELLVAERHPDAFEAARRVTERALGVGARRTASAALRLAERAAGADLDRIALLQPLRQRAERAIAQ